MGPIALIAWLAAAPLRAGVVEDRLAGDAAFGALQTLRVADFSASPAAVPAPPKSVRPKAVRSHPAIHSALSFANVQWPSDLTEDDKAAFEVALNISGSFEGGDAWANLTNNFDGQGLSLGLLNQCLGQGSLQPLLISMRKTHPDRLQALFSPEHLKSLSAMLDDWLATKDDAPAEKRLSITDESPVEEQAEVDSADNRSVAWAVKTLYSGTDFIPAWKSELTALANDPDYISLQIAAALDYHLKAVAYEAQIGVRQFRAYLMLFDIVVQDGGLHPEDLTDYAAYVKANPKASAPRKLNELLTLRLRKVRSRFKADVRQRKTAIINGTGKVHGESRNLPVEYNYDPKWAYR